MNKDTVSFLRSVTLLILLIARPFPVLSADTMIVGVAGPAINMIYSFVARDAGFWQNHGIDGRVVIFDAGSILAQAALSGQVKFSVSSGPATIASRTQGAESIIVALALIRSPIVWSQPKG